ncbi:DUF4148 domain-containing protein [Caballeronia sp. Lep1P3]|uniref:DUF4148 domain-containing protein n=1 Tax=Caballeronia sp. Lep1P3 TaxID=2878150 RepID=UPI001FD50667|nr:DUF4148 domain-containing protein [Caballeronia sp. Lep1P3]
MIRSSSLLATLACAAAVSMPMPMSALAQTAQTAQPTTRERAQCELRELESVGYKPWENDYYYPRNLEIAQARLAAKKRAQGLEGVDTCAGGGAPAAGKTP